MFLGRRRTIHNNQMGKSGGAMAERDSANDATEDWQNVVAPPQNVTQQSNGKARAQRQNAAVHWQNIVAPPLNNAARWQQRRGCGDGGSTNRAKSAAAWRRRGGSGSVSGNGGCADVGSGSSATARRWRWRQHASAILAEAWRQHGGGSSVSSGGGSAKRCGGCA
jgi:hypothetical protein